MTQQHDNKKEDQVDNKEPQGAKNEEQPQVQQPQNHQGKGKGGQQNQQQAQQQQAQSQAKEQEPAKGTEAAKEEKPKAKAQDLKPKKERLLRSLNSFCNVMHPDRQHDGAKAGRAHATLSRRLREILNEQSSKDAKELWLVFLEFVRENPETFSARNVFRYVQYWNSDRKEYDFYRTVMFIAIRYNPGNLRENLKNVKVDAILAHLDKKQSANYTSIYNLD